MSTNSKSIVINDNLIQWVLIISTALFRIETIVLLIILMTTRWKGFSTYLCVAIVLLVHAFSSVVLYDYTIVKPVQQICLVGIHFIGYCTFFYYYVSDPNELWRKYLKFCYWAAVVGVVQFICMMLFHMDPLSFLSTNPDKEIGEIMELRIHSFFLEPGYFSVYLVPYIVYSILNFKEINKKEFCLVSLVFILTFAVAGFFAFAAFVVYKMIKSKHWVVTSLLISLLLLSVVVSMNEMSQDEDNGAFAQSINKVNQTFEAFEEMDPEAFELLNLSTYATMTNLWVSYNAPNRLIGTGIGTHEQNYTTLYVSSYQYYGFNKEDAYSAGTRIFSEFGIIGLIIVFIYIFKCYNEENSINISILFYILACLIRGGHYTANGIFFFCMLYFFTSYNVLNKNANNKLYDDVNKITNE